MWDNKINVFNLKRSVILMSINLANITVWVVQIISWLDGLRRAKRQELMLGY